MVVKHDEVALPVGRFARVLARQVEARLLEKLHGRDVAPIHGREDRGNRSVLQGNQALDGLPDESEAAVPRQQPVAELGSRGYRRGSRGSWRPVGPCLGALALANG